MTSIIRIRIVFGDIFGLVHHPIEGLHVELSFQLKTNVLTDFGVILVEPLFLQRNRNKF